MKYLTRISLLIVALTCPIAFSGAASGTPAPSNQASSQDSPQSPEFKAAEDGAQRYIAAYNKGDAQTLAFVTDAHQLIALLVRIRDQGRI